MQHGVHYLCTGSFLITNPIEGVRCVMCTLYLSAHFFYLASRAQNHVNEIKNTLNVNWKISTP